MSLITFNLLLGRLCEGLSSVDVHDEDADLQALAFLFYKILHYPDSIRNSIRLNNLFVKRFASFLFVVTHLKATLRCCTLAACTSAHIPHHLSIEELEAAQVEWQVTLKSPGLYMLLMHAGTHLSSLLHLQLCQEEEPCAHTYTSLLSWNVLQLRMCMCG
jgi:hypothetical protein